MEELCKKLVMINDLLSNEPGLKERINKDVKKIVSQYLKDLKLSQKISDSQYLGIKQQR